MGEGERQTDQAETLFSMFYWKGMHLHAWLSPIITASYIFIYVILSHNDDAEHAIPPILELIYPMLGPAGFQSLCTAGCVNFCMCVYACTAYICVSCVCLT